MKKKHGLGGLIAALVLAAAIAAIRELNLLSTSTQLILQYIGIYSIMVMGVNIINGYMGTFSLAHAGFMAVGAYASALASRYLLTSSWLFPLAILIGGLAAALVGLLVAIPSFHSKGDYLAIITLGFTLMMQSILNNMEIVGASRGMTDLPKYTNLYYVYGTLVILIVLLNNFIASRFGRSIKAIREDQLATELVSVNVRAAKTIAFALSAFYIGVAGALMCHLLGYTSPSSYGYSNVVDGLVMVYVGGVGSITGSITGSIIWQVLVQSLKDLGTWRWVVGGLLLCVVMIFLPKGIFGYREITDLFRSVGRRAGKGKEAE